MQFVRRHHELFGHLDTGLVTRLAWCIHNLECRVLHTAPYCFVSAVHHLSNGESDRVPFVGLIIHCISHIGLHLVVDATGLSCNI